MNSPRYAPAGLLIERGTVRVAIDGGPGAEPAGPLAAWLVTDQHAELIRPLRRMAAARRSPRSRRLPRQRAGHHAASGRPHLAPDLWIPHRGRWYPRRLGPGVPRIPRLGRRRRPDVRRGGGLGTSHPFRQERRRARTGAAVAGQAARHGGRRLVSPMSAACHRGAGRRAGSPFGRSESKAASTRPGHRRLDGARPAGGPAALMRGTTTAGQL